MAELRLDRATELCNRRAHRLTIEGANAPHGGTPKHCARPWRLEAHDDVDSSILIGTTTKAREINRRRVCNWMWPARVVVAFGNNAGRCN